MGNRRRSILFASGMIEVTQMVVIKSSEIYTIPVDTVKLDAFIVGAGGGGGLPVAPTSYGSYTAGYAGKGGTVVYQENIPFIKGEEMTVVIGQGGVAATTANNAGNKGGDTFFGTLIALGGSGGAAGTNSSPSIGRDGIACPFGDIESESIASTDLFGANGGDGSITTMANAGGNTGAGKGANRSTAAAAGVFYGSAGGGGTIYRSFSNTIRNAGSGYQGIAILKVVRRMKESDMPLVVKTAIITDVLQTSWSVPANTKKIDVFIVAGGGSGFGSNQMNVLNRMITGGRGGQVLYVEDIPFTKNKVFNLKIGDQTANTSYTGVKGNDTTFGEYTAIGGATGAMYSGSAPTTHDGKKCIFEDINPNNLYGADGGTVSNNNGEILLFDGGKTGGGKGSSQGGKDATFYGSGGGAHGVLSGAMSYPGRGYQGIIIIRYYVRTLE